MAVKVFELAKELDIGAVDLVEKLRGIGLNVRNHMVALSEEEVQQAKDALAPASSAKATKKKKTVKKKATKKAASTTSATGKKTKKKVVVKRKKGPTKKAPSEDADKGPSEAAEVKQPDVSTAQDTQTVKPAEQPAVVQKDSIGQGPLAKTAAEQAREAKEAEKNKAQVVIEEVDEKGDSVDKKTNTDDDILRPKLHSFTPVYVPETPKQESDSTESGTNDSDEGSSKDGKSKKRLGSLAAIVNKKGAGDKSKDLNLIRAEEEMKFATSVVGRAVYTPARKKKVYTGATKQTVITEVKDSKRVVNLHGGATADELAQKLSQKFEAMQNKALDLNLLIKPEDFVGIKLAEKIAALYDYRVEDRSFNEEEVIEKPEEQSKADSNLAPRSPIITVMGHVDHGKTTLLDSIRKAKVASGEAGGITQHIGAYSVKVKDKEITFLDTPGHAAFANMRSRGAQVTDIVILVVAADDGVMPQTKESIKFCQSANVPIIVAVNKIDKEDSNPDRIKQELTEFNITPEEWGGDTQFVPISALKEEGIDKLLESVQLQAEIMELRANPKGKAQGVVIESNLEKGRGPVATILVQSGTLSKGDSIVVGETFGRARSLMDYAGNMLKNAGPSTPVEILGLNEVPNPGDMLNVVKNEREAKKIVQNRVDERKQLELAEQNKPMALEDFFADTAGGEGQRKLALIIRADVQGSYEAIKNALEGLGNDEVAVEVVGGGVGAITDNDVMMAESVGGYLIGFNMRPVTSARKLAEQKSIDLKTYSIIYELINDVKLALEGMLAPEFSEKFIGRAEIREVFQVPKVGAIAGSMVIDGKIERGANIRLLRDGKIIHDGKISSLKRFKDDVKEVKNGFECGVGLDGFNDLKVGDLFEAYVMEEQQRTLQSSNQNADSYSESRV